MSNKTTNRAVVVDGDDEDAQKRKVMELKVDYLRSRLEPLKLQSFYKDHLSLSGASIKRWLDEARGCPILAEAKMRGAVGLKRGQPIKSDQYNHPIEPYVSGGLCSKDRQGDPVHFQLYGFTDMKGLHLSHTQDQLVIFWSKYFDKLVKVLDEAYTNSKGKVYNMLLVVDMQKTDNMHFQWPTLCAWTKVIQQMHRVCPAFFKEILLLHPPCALPVLHAFLWPRLDKLTRERVKVIQNPDCLSHLLRRIEKHEIPAYLGGYVCDRDNNPYCHQRINWAEKVPRWAYLSDHSLCAEVTDLLIMPGCSEQLELEVVFADSHIVWHLLELSHDVTIKCYGPPCASTDESENKEGEGKAHCTCASFNKPITTKRVKANQLPHSGLTCAHQVGVHRLVLDNAKNLTHPLKVKVKVDVLMPPGSLSRFERKIPLGDSIDFYKPMAEDEIEKKNAHMKQCEQLYF